MNIDEFAKRVEDVRSYMDALQESSGALPPQKQEVLQESFGQFQIALEELQVAEEELLQQNEELGAARQALEAKHQRYQELFEFAPDGYLVTSAEGAIREANRAASALLNLLPERLINKPLVLFVAEEERRAFRSELNRLSQAGRAQEWVVRLQPRDREPLYAALSVSAVRGPRGEPVTLRWLIRDITERKRAENEVRRLNAELERRVLERTAQLDQANRLKDQFMAILAHELRNPLGAILNGIELLKALKPADPQLLQIYAIIDRQARQQARLLDDLLDVTRISRGKITLCMERVDLARLVREAAEDHRRSLEEAGLTLSPELPKAPVWVQVDPTRLSQVLSNLLDNAAKFTPAGGQVLLRLETSPGGGRAVVTVRDTGIGIEPEMMPEVFKAFVQSDRSLDRSRSGMGLGLALVKGLIELHGGEVHAHSPGPGQGTELTLLLPLERGTETEQKTAPPESSAGSPLRILIVDDNRDAANLLGSLLRRDGHEVKVAYSGAAGLAAIRELRPEVVLCDIGLPGMDGYVLAAELRRDPASALARLIAVTGYGQKEDRRRSQEAGFDHHLTKPVDLAELRRLLALSVK